MTALTSNELATALSATRSNVLPGGLRTSVSIVKPPSTATSSTVVSSESTPSSSSMSPIVSIMLRILAGVIVVYLVILLIRWIWGCKEDKDCAKHCPKLLAGACVGRCKSGWCETKTQECNNKKHLSWCPEKGRCVNTSHELCRPPGSGPQKKKPSPDIKKPVIITGASVAAKQDRHFQFVNIEEKNTILQQPRADDDVYDTDDTVLLGNTGQAAVLQGVSHDASFTLHEFSMNKS